MTFPEMSLLKCLSGTEKDKVPADHWFSRLAEWSLSKGGSSDKSS